MFKSVLIRRGSKFRKQTFVFQFHFLILIIVNSNENSKEL